MSGDDDLPAFIRQHVRSVWALEILLLLRREPLRAWPVSEIVRELRAAAALVTGNLERFERSGLIHKEAEAFRFAPASPVLAQLCEALNAAYVERPVAIINIISAPEDRLPMLAEAFRFRGKRC